MTVELLKTLSFVSFILAGVLFLAAAALFFLLRVPRLFGDVTGATARKAIENIRQQNAESGDKAYKPSPVNAARGKVTDKISPSGHLQHRTGGFGGSPGTQKISTARLAEEASETMVLREQEYGPANETAVLQETAYVRGGAGANETEVLGEAAYGTGYSPGGATEVLPGAAYASAGTTAGETEVLGGPEYGRPGKGASPGENTRFRQPESGFWVEAEQGFLASAELIE